MEANRLSVVESSPIRDLMDEVAKLKEKYDDVVSFCAGEPDFDTPEDIKIETIRALMNNETHYASSYGVLKLRKKISKLIYSATGCKYDAQDEIMVTSGAAEAINNVLLSFINPEDEVIVLTPAFITYKNIIKMCGAKFVEVALKWENNYQIDMKEIMEKTTDKTKAIVLNNPCNPTGAVFNKKSLEELCVWAKEKDIMIISDEIYSDIVYEGAKAHSIAEFDGMKERLIIISGFSKTYAMTGWRLGYIATNREYMETILKMHTYCSTCSPTFLQSGLAEAVDSERTQQEVRHMVETFGKRRKLAIGLSEKCKNIKISIPYGAFYILLDISKTGMDGKTFSEELLRKKHVAVVPADSMGMGCKNIVRMSYACSESMIEEGLKRLYDFTTANDYISDNDGHRVFNC